MKGDYYMCDHCLKRTLVPPSNDRRCLDDWLELRHTTRDGEMITTNYCSMVCLATTIAGWAEAHKSTHEPKS